MRYELSDYEWSVTKPMLPNKPRGTNAPDLERGVPPSPRDRRHPQTPMAVANSCLPVEP